MFILNSIPITLDVKAILRGQGVQPDKADPKLFADAAAILEEAQELVSPRALFSVFKVRDYHHQIVELEDGGFFEGKLAVRTLAGSREVALGICTIGSAIDNRSEELFRRDPVKAMALAGAAIAALRSASEAMLQEIRDFASEKGWGSGMRAQPGQEGWPIEQQKVIFDRLPAEKIEIKLTESSLMIPKSSVSSVVGLGPDMHPEGVACDFCSKRKNCPWRIED